MISFPRSNRFPNVSNKLPFTMSSRTSVRLFLFSLVCALLSASVYAQQPTSQSDDVVRVSTDLVQSDFMVFDKQGNFVDGLKKDQFVLKVEGKSREITFFDRITAGSRNEEAQLAAARGNAAIGKPPVPLDRGRLVMFFIDDLHLSPGSVNETRKLLKNFIEREMGQNDQVAIASVSGQLGFLQQFTDNKAVLRAVTDRLKVQQAIMQSPEHPPMTEFHAMQIEKGDDDVLNYFVDALLAETPGLPRETAVQMVRSRAARIIQNAQSITTRTLGTLKGTIDITAVLPGRKIIFLISDGFFVEQNHSDNLSRVQRITAAAARAGAVIYSIDARGLTPGLPDASQAVAFDPSGRLQRGSLGELRASQDAINALAADSGGRAFFNTNDLSAAVTKGLKETSVYYLLAWRPENDEQRNPKFRRLEVSVAGRSELVVRFRRGFGEPNPDDAAKRAKEPLPARKPPAEEIGAALRASYPARGLPVSIALNYLDTVLDGPTLTTAIKVGTSSLPLEPQAGVPTALMDLAGLVLNDQGKSVASFNKHITIRGNPDATTVKPPENFFFNHFTVIKPGLYQVRVAAIDSKQGTIGSAYQWIEIPDVQTKALAMSSLIVGEHKPPQADDSNATLDQAKTPEELRKVSINIDHRFPRSSYLRFLTFIYNARSSTTPPQAETSPASPGTTPSAVNGSSLDLTVQVQVFRDDEPVITMPLHKISTEGVTDLQRVPYAADVILNNLPPGAYVLQVTIIDRIAKTSASQRLSFQVD
jgi:VWFA-related protein